MYCSWKKQLSEACHDLREFEGRGGETAAAGCLKPAFKGTVLEPQGASADLVTLSLPGIQPPSPKGTHVTFSFKLEWHKKAATSLSGDVSYPFQLHHPHQQRSGTLCRGPQSRSQGDHHREGKYVTCWQYTELTLMDMLNLHSPPPRLYFSWGNMTSLFWQNVLSGRWRQTTALEPQFIWNCQPFSSRTNDAEVFQNLNTIVLFNSQKSYFSPDLCLITLLKSFKDMYKRYTFMWDLVWTQKVSKI